MLKKRFVAVVAIGFLLPTIAFAQSGRPFETGATYSVCFTPAGDCQGMIVAAIATAKTTIKIQAYSFTSAPIAKAILDAKKRGVSVEAIVDKSQRSAKYTGATFLANAGIPVLVDEKPAIAHNKIILIDDATRSPTVITGSFNFTKAAQEKNAENILIIRGDQTLTDAYLTNFES